MENLMISSLELAELLDIPVRHASRVIREVNKELEARGIYVFKAKIPRAPRQMVLQKLGIEVK